MNDETPRPEENDEQPAEQPETATETRVDREMVEVEETRTVEQPAE